jgi:hypothetical protein
MLEYSWFSITMSTTGAVGVAAPVGRCTADGLDLGESVTIRVGTATGCECLAFAQAGMMTSAIAAM